MLTDRPGLLRLLALGWGLALAAAAAAYSLDQMPLGEIQRGLKATLEQSARSATSTLGRYDGFWGNPKARIPLPAAVLRARSTLVTMGRSKQIDELERGMNAAAEQAVPLLQQHLLDAVRDLTIYDAKGIVRGGSDAATQYYRSRTQAELARRFLPTVRQITERQGLARPYNALADKARPLSLVNNEQPTVEAYVTAKTLDAIYAAMAEQERKLRANPGAAPQEPVRKLFGAVR